MTTLDEIAERRIREITEFIHAAYKNPVTALDGVTIENAVRVLWKEATEAAWNKRTTVTRLSQSAVASPSLEEKLRVLLELKDRALRESQSGMADSRGMDRLTAATLQAIIDDISQGGLDEQ